MKRPHSDADIARAFWELHDGEILKAGSVSTSFSNASTVMVTRDYKMKLDMALERLMELEPTFFDEQDQE